LENISLTLGVQDSSEKKEGEGSKTPASLTDGALKEGKKSFSSVEEVQSRGGGTERWRWSYEIKSNLHVLRLRGSGGKRGGGVGESISLQNRVGK